MNGEIVTNIGVVAGYAIGQGADLLYRSTRTEGFFPISRAHQRAHEPEATVNSEQQKIESIARQVAAEPDPEKRKELNHRLVKEHMLAKAESPLDALMIENMYETDEGKKRELRNRMIGAAFVDIYFRRRIVRIREELQKHPRFSSFVGRAVAPLALTGSLLGGSAAALWTSSENPQVSAAPQASVELVIDHTANTLFDGTLANVNGLIKTFGEDSKFKVQVLPAGHSDSAPVPESPAEAIKDPAYGSAAFDNTVQNAIGRNRETAGVVLITDDDGLEAPSTTETAAREAKVPIFVVNVSGTNDATTEQLEQLASATHGKYWNSKTSDSTIVQSVYSSLEHQPESAGNKSNNNDADVWLPEMIALAGVLGISLASRPRYVPVSLPKANNNEGDK
jgi:hypothetical protein